MKKLLFVLSLFISSQLAIAQEKSDKNLVKTFETKEATSISFQCNQKSVQPAQWDDALLRVELLVKANMPMQVLEQLVKAGRYTLESKFDENGDLIIIAPHIEKHVSVRGTDLVEEITVFVKTPGEYQLVEGKTLSKKIDDIALRNLKNEKDEEVIKKLKRINTTVQTSIKLQSSSRQKISKKELQEILKSHILIDGNPLIIE